MWTEKHVKYLGASFDWKTWGPIMFPTAHAKKREAVLIDFLVCPATLRDRRDMRRVVVPQKESVHQYPMRRPTRVEWEMGTAIPC